MSLNPKDFETINVHVDGQICHIKFNRAEENNSINLKMIEEFDVITSYCSEVKHGISILVLSGNSDVFSLGGDFVSTANDHGIPDPSLLFDSWYRMATGSFISICLVEGRVNAGGLGFIAASDIVLAGPRATFSLSEMIFGLFPACVLPFLIRRIGYQKANYMTLMTNTIGAEKAKDWHLVDEFSDQIDDVLRLHLIRLKRLDKRTIKSYKHYMNETQSFYLKQAKNTAVNANRSMFSDETIKSNIKRYVDDLKFPWEA
jgi:polyketide biosynthesis enoyl-CoA hydratase PksH